jgi:hypothetical protein
MDPAVLFASLAEPKPPAGLNRSAEAMWWAKRGNWDQAHRVAQDDPSREGSWVHAYLHRVEGDEGNASYWYSRAGETRPSCSLDEEWEQIVGTL